MGIIQYLHEIWTMAVTGQAQGAFFFVASYAFLALGYSAVKQVRVLAWPSVQGKIERAEIKKVSLSERLKSTQDFVATAVYHYQVNGVEYEGNEISTRAMLSSRNARYVLKRHLEYVQQNANGELTVYYHPQKPVKAVLILPSRLSILFAFALCLLPMSLYLWEYHL